jgi:hypothetical protein
VAGDYPIETSPVNAVFGHHPDHCPTERDIPARAARPGPTIKGRGNRLIDVLPQQAFDPLGMQPAAFMSQMIAAVREQPAVILEIGGTAQHGNAGLRHMSQDGLDVAPGETRFKIH